MSIVKRHLNQQAKDHSIIRTLRTNLIMFMPYQMQRQKCVLDLSRFLLCFLSEITKMVVTQLWMWHGKKGNLW